MDKPVEAAIDARFDLPAMNTFAATRPEPTIMTTTNAINIYLKNETDFLAPTALSLIGFPQCGHAGASEDKEPLHSGQFIIAISSYLFLLSTPNQFLIAYVEAEKGERRYKPFSRQ
jgi:hypothetical protein